MIITAIFRVFFAGLFHMFLVFISAIDINLDNVTSTTEQIFASDDTLPVVENLSVNEQPTNILDKSEYCK